MRSSRLAALGGALIASLLAAGCASGEGPGWTYQPAASVTAAPSGAASGEPSAPASGEPSGSAAPSGDGGGTQVAIAAQGIQFDTDALTAPADTDFQIAFDNQDNGVPHDVDIRDGSGQTVADNDIVTGPTQVVYDVAALAAGEYQFVCSVHPNMVGTLTVE